jgi:glycosyltransferase involved in cell wall biosynthesis
LPSVYRDSEGNVHDAPELMGFTLLESMACGTPAIASRVGGMPEFIREEETGFVYNSLDELTTYLRRMATDADRVERMGRRASQVVREEFDYRVAGEKLYAVYRSLGAGLGGVAA